MQGDQGRAVPRYRGRGRRRCHEGHPGRRVHASRRDNGRYAGKRAGPARAGTFSSDGAASRTSPSFPKTASCSSTPPSRRRWSPTGPSASPGRASRKPGPRSSPNPEMETKSSCTLVGTAPRRSPAGRCSPVPDPDELKSVGSVPPQGLRDHRDAANGRAILRRKGRGRLGPGTRHLPGRQTAGSGFRPDAPEARPRELLVAEAPMMGRRAAAGEPSMVPGRGNG